MEGGELLVVVALAIILYVWFENPTRKDETEVELPANFKSCNCNTSVVPQNSGRQSNGPIKSCNCNTSVVPQNSGRQSNGPIKSCNCNTSVVPQNSGSQSQGSCGSKEHFTSNENTKDGSDDDDTESNTDETEKEQPTPNTTSSDDLSMPSDIPEGLGNQLGNQNGTVYTTYQELVNPPESIQLMTGAEYLQCSKNSNRSVFRYVVDSLDPQNVFSDDVTCAGGSASSSMGCGIGESRVPNGIVDPILETTRCTANGLSGCLSATPMGVGCGGEPVANF
jgi:hypothetical protein